MEVEYLAANEFILQLCVSILARNFMWAISFSSFNDVPDKLLISCIKHPDLTVDSEWHLCNAILTWLTTKTAKSESWTENIDIDKVFLEQIHTGLLPLWVAAGKRKCRFFSKAANEATATILSQAKHPYMSLMDVFREVDLDHHRIRLTKYTKKVDLSRCPQIMLGFVLLSLLPSSSDAKLLRKIIKTSSISHANIGVDGFQISKVILRQVLTFEAVQEIDISNCPLLSLESFIDAFCKSFPSLRILKAAYHLNFKTTKLCQLVQKFPLLTNIDLTLDINPFIPCQVSVISSSIAHRSATLSDMYNRCSATSLSYITKLTLEGRTDLSDFDLQHISEVCISLNYVNMKGCVSVTDSGISAMILQSRKLQSLLACNTSFGNISVLALFSDNSSEKQPNEHRSQMAANKFLDLHIGGCSGIDEVILSELLAGADYLKSLCIRGTGTVDNALYRFSGASLEMLDVSDTKVSCAALSQIIHRNPNLKCIKIKGCMNLTQVDIESKERELCNALDRSEELYTELGKSCKLEEIELGWGFSFLSIGALKPAIRTLRTIRVGLGGFLGDDGLKLLPTLCPLLETLILYFQVISDSVIENITKSLPHLQFLALCYCFGHISSTGLRFKFRMPNLRILKLERVTPWMSNEDLSALTENCPSLINISFIGCTLLNSESQAIISSGWPGLTSLRLEECGEITATGVGSLLNCHALEDLILRHNGSGIPRNFIVDAASRLPMLRKLSVDICDAKDSDFDIPYANDRYFLSSVKIARCKLERCTLLLHNLEPRRTPVHKETLVLVWNSEKLERTVVKERL